MSLITRKDLEEAIAKCQGQKNPTANTCIKLAAYYTILDHTPEDDYSGYSYASRPSNSEFMRVIKKKSLDEVLLVIDDMMEELQGAMPKLYYETMERLSET